MSNGKIEHPEAGTQGSKDAIDGVCGALWNASQHAEQYAYDYGETIDTYTKVSGENDWTDKEQIMIDFEEELKKIRNPLSPDKIQQQTENKKEKSGFMNFGFGEATDYNGLAFSDGIIVF